RPTSLPTTPHTAQHIYPPRRTPPNISTHHDAHHPISLPATPPPIEIRQQATAPPTVSPWARGTRRSARVSPGYAVHRSRSFPIRPEQRRVGRVRGFPCAPCPFILPSGSHMQRPPHRPPPHIRPRSRVKPERSAAHPSP